MAHLSLSQSFLVPVPKPAVSLQPASPLSPPLSPAPQYFIGLQPTVILALRARTTHVLMPSIRTKRCKFAWLNEERERSRRLVRRRLWLVLRHDIIARVLVVQIQCAHAMANDWCSDRGKLKFTHGKLIMFGCTPAGCSAIPSIKSSSN